MYIHIKMQRLCTSCGLCGYNVIMGCNLCGDPYCSVCLSKHTCKSKSACVRCGIITSIMRTCRKCNKSLCDSCISPHELICESGYSKSPKNESKNEYFIGYSPTNPNYEFKNIIYNKQPSNDTNQHTDEKHETC